MNESENLVPKRRFKEFTNTGTWGQRKSKEICTISTGKGNTQDKIDDGKYPFYVRSATIERSNDYLYDQEAVLTVGDGVGTGKVFHYVNGKYNLHQRVYRMFDFNNEVSAKYFYYYFSKKFYRRVMAMTAKTSVDSVRLEMIADMIIEFPSPKEQQKIVKLFESLDDAIALHQRKLDKTKSLKSAYLLEMFPAEGERKPKRRFAGFTDDWEQRKFEEMLDKNDGVRRGPFGSALKKEIFVKNSDYVVYEQQNAIYDNYKTRYNITKEKFDELHKFSLKENDFIMSGAGTIGRISRVPKGIKKGVFNQALIRFRINNELTNPEYFLQFVRAENMQRKLTGANPGSAISNLVPMSEVKKWEVFVPIKAEQKKLGSFFEQLDDTIALHQHKLEKLKNIKQAYLNELFV